MSLLFQVALRLQSDTNADDSGESLVVGYDSGLVVLGWQIHVSRSRLRTGFAAIGCQRSSV